MNFSRFGAFKGYFWTAVQTSEACSFRTTGSFVSFQSSKIFLISRSLVWSIDSVGVHLFLIIPMWSIGQLHPYSTRWEKTVVVLFHIYEARAIFLLLYDHPDTYSE